MAQINSSSAVGLVLQADMTKDSAELAAVLMVDDVAGKGSNALGRELNTVLADLDGNLDAEIVARAAADSTELARAESVEAILVAADSSEAIARAAADSTELARAESVEAILVAADSTEKARAELAESDLSDEIAKSVWDGAAGTFKLSDASSSVTMTFADVNGTMQLNIT